MSRWTLDAAHTEVGFSARHMMVTTVKGQFHGVEADIDIDADHPERSHVEARIDAASIDTRNAERDAHVKSPDFLDVEHHPQITFRSTEVRRVGDDAVEIAGDLTIRDVTRPVTLRGEFSGPVADPWGGRRAGFELTTELERGEFGLNWNVALESGGWLVGKKVRLTITAEIVESVPAAAQA